MYKTLFVIALASCGALATPEAKPGVFAAAYTAPVVAPAVVTAQSSQVVARTYNGLVTPVVAAAPFVKAAPLLAAPVVRAAPFVTAPHLHGHYYNPYVAAPAPVFV